MPADSRVHNKTQLYIKSQLSTRVQILKLAFEKGIAPNHQKLE